MKKCILILAVILVGTAFMLSACGKAKEEADVALKAAEKAINDVKTDAAKFVPDQVKSLEAALNSAREKFNKGDYKAALTEAQAIPAKAKEIAAKVHEVLAAANAKKEEQNKAWANLSQEVPKMIEAIKSRMDIISKSKKLPKKVTKEKVAGAKAELDAILKGWPQVEESFKAGNVEEAIAKGNSFKDKAAQVLQNLDVPLPGTAK